MWNDNGNSKPDMDNKKEYNEILKVLERRASKTRAAIFILVYSLVVVVTFVMMGAFYLKSNEPSFDAFINSIIGKSEQEKKQEAFNQLVKALDGLTISQNVISGTIRPKETNIQNNNSEINQSNKNLSSSEMIASSIATVLLSLSIMIFIGFVMKAMLIFVRYYMQLGTDFENQKIAFILSKGEQSNFNITLTVLREHNINFEKTPSLPQEKIITGLIEAIGLAKDKQKNNS